MEPFIKHLEVHKFGGKAIADAHAINQTFAVVNKKHSLFPLLFVFSAPGKTTNDLEEVFECWKKGDTAWIALFDTVVQKQYRLVESLHLHSKNKRQAIGSLRMLRDRIVRFMASQVITEATYGEIYDRIVSCGEFFATAIMHEVFDSNGIKVAVFDAPELIKTDSVHTRAQVLLPETVAAITLSSIEKALFLRHVAMTQGFVGGTLSGVTTLGREGSDYSLAIIAYALGAKSATKWTDVPGVYTEDPNVNPDAKRYENISYDDAYILVTEKKAQIVHPQAILLAKEKEMTLHVRSFKHSADRGTSISGRPTVLQ